MIKKYLKKLFSLVERYHRNEFWKVFLEKVTDITGSGASEYEIYFNYMLWYHRNEIIVRKLNWINTSINNLKIYELNKKYNFISLHWHLR